jgi:hypothetical protein
MNNSLLIVFIIFAVIDLTLVATTCLCVMLLVRKVLLGKVEIKIADKKVRIDRDFIEKGE